MVQYRHLDRTLAALADPTRRAILEHLRRGDASISELAEPLAITLTGTKKQVRILEEAELVTTRKVGRVRSCALGPRRMEDVTDWVEHHRQVMEERFDRFERVLEREQGMEP